jgi:hypothetical protein
VSELKHKLKDMGYRAPYFKLEPRPEHYSQSLYHIGLKDSYYEERNKKQQELNEQHRLAREALIAELEAKEKELIEVKTRRKYQPKEPEAKLRVEGNRAILVPQWQSAIEECSIECKPTSEFTPRSFNVDTALAQLKDHIEIDVEIKDDPATPTAASEATQ